jgi:hypothetical protein
MTSVGLSTCGAPGNIIWGKTGATTPPNRLGRPCRSSEGTDSDTGDANVDMGGTGSERGTIGGVTGFPMCSGEMDESGEDDRLG